MIHFAITGGGTEEPIDGVRKITNMSSGSLAWHCLEAIFLSMKAKNIKDFTIHYIKAPGAITKALTSTERSKIKFIEVIDTKDVYDTIDKLTKEEKIDIFIHAMAISDFSYSYSVSISDLADELSNKIKREGVVTKEGIHKVLISPEKQHRRNNKISSDNDIIMGFKTTPKVIPLIKRNNKNTFLVGFKLITHNHNNNLIEEAEQLRLRNSCDAVFANEASDLSEEGHTGLLLYKGEIVAKPSGKMQIAQSIIDFSVNKKLI